MTVSYFEWVQDLGVCSGTATRSVRSSPGDVTDAFDRVWHLADEQGISLRNAALVAGIREVAGGARGARHLPVSAWSRDAMVRSPLTLGGRASAQEAGALLARPEVRAVFVCDGRALVGVVTRKTLVREVVAPGRDPRDDAAGRDRRAAALHDRAVLPWRRRSGSSRSTTLERVPVIDGRTPRRRAVALRAAAPARRGRGPFTRRRLTANLRAAWGLGVTTHAVVEEDPSCTG